MKKTLTNFLIESLLIGESSNPTSDDAILFKIGEHKYLKTKQIEAPGTKTTDKYNIKGSNYRKGVIDYAKAVTPDLLPDSDEIIHRKSWDLDGIIGETEYQLMHKDYWIMNDFIYKNKKREHDTLTILQCSNSKPYSNNNVFKNYYIKWFRGFTDFAAISNPGVIPLEYSHFYPYRYDEWDHSAEKPDIAKKYIWICASRFLRYVKKMGYKKIIVVMQAVEPQAWAQYIVDHNSDNFKDKLLIVNDKAHNPEFMKKAKAKYKTPGFDVQRLNHQEYFLDRYIKLLRSTLNNSEQKDLDEILKIRKIESNTKRKEELEKFNKEHNIIPEYDMTWSPENKSDTPLVSPEKSINKEIVKKYEKFVKKYIDSIENIFKKETKDNESKKYHKDGLIFTVLDLLMSYYKDELIDDPDSYYWNMDKAVKNIVKSNKNIIEQLNAYCYAYKPLIKEIGIDNIKKYTNKLGITMFNDERRSDPDK